MGRHGHSTDFSDEDCTRYIIKMNEIELPVTYPTREAAVEEVHRMFGETEFDTGGANIIFWPSVSARGNTKIEIAKGGA